MARMGISTYMSYVGAQIFEAVGLRKSFVDKYFTNTPSPIEGLDLFDVAREAVEIHRRAFSTPIMMTPVLPAGVHRSVPAGRGRRSAGQSVLLSVAAPLHL